MELNWKGLTIPVSYLYEDDMLEYLQNRFKNIDFKIVKKEMGLKYGIKKLNRNRSYFIKLCIFKR